MNSTTTKNPILTAVGEDASQTIAGGTQLPLRDASGNRFYNIGENRVFRIFEPKVRLIQNAIKKALKELGIGEATRKILGAELQSAQKKYETEQRADEEKLAKLDDQIETAEMEVAPMPLPVEDEAPKKKENKRKEYGWLSFLLVTFVSEFVTTLATFDLQREALSSGAIWWRIGYVLVIFYYTVHLYKKYMRTGLLSIKAALIGCILLSFVSLIHAIAVTFLDLDVTTATNIGFDLVSVQPQDVETSQGISSKLIDKLLVNPGLGEMLLATLIVLLTECTTTNHKKEVVETVAETSSLPSEEPMLIDFGTATQQSAAHHFAILKEKRAKLLERCNNRTTAYEEYVNSINAQLEANELKMEQAQTDLDKNQQEMESLLDKVVSDLANYRKLLLNELAFRLAVEVSSFKYEPATKADVKAYYNL